MILAVALQAAMAAAQAVPKEGTQLKEMLKSTSSHSTLAHVLTHLWHTERLWRHALHQGLQLFQETHQVCVGGCAGVRAGGSGGGGGEGV